LLLITIVLEECLNIRVLGCTAPSWRTTASRDRRARVILLLLLLLIISFATSMAKAAASLACATCR
jgi:hypothetical protein